MKVIVETPRWNLVKYTYRGGMFQPEFFSPLPTLFNYGFVKGTKGEDGLPEDAIVLGPRLKQGTEVEVMEFGAVYFIDDGRKDDKRITGEGPVTLSDRLMIRLFFTAYAVFKTVYYLLSEGRFARCRYGGFGLNRSV